MRPLLVILLLFINLQLITAQEGTFQKAVLQASNSIQQMVRVADSTPLLFPRTIVAEGVLKGTNLYDWTSGFFPGNLWYLYEQTKDETLKTAALRWTEKLEPLQYFTKHHDLGFMMYCSYGNAYKLTGNKTYKDILIQTARSLCTRFNAITGTIKSWNEFKGFENNTVHYYPVIIDNMMNLELLMFAYKATGDTLFKQVAVTHANTTMLHHFRKDYSSYHVVCYDSITGKPVAKETAQGYADASAWARGQAWGFYGYTMMYRETKDPRYLKVARGIAQFLLQHPTLPNDMVPIWDFNANQKGFMPGTRSKVLEEPVLYRDASAAAIIASALLELSLLSKKEQQRYFKAAEKILTSLASTSYTAAPGTNGNFTLKHSVGNLPRASEVDVPLVYADYYYFEALSRYQHIVKGEPIF